jgi:hypothetical protein
MNIHMKKMDAEKLIEAVKARPILYETTKKSYKDTAKKEDAWKEVGEEVGCSGKTFKSNLLIVLLIKNVSLLKAVFRQTCWHAVFGIFGGTACTFVSILSMCCEKTLFGD